MTHKERGALGGRSTFQRHGREHMQAIGRRGAASTWARYQLVPAGVAGWVLVERSTNTVRAFLGSRPW